MFENVQFITENGHNKFAVIPYTEFLRLKQVWHERDLEKLPTVKSEVDRTEKSTSAQFLLSLAGMLPADDTITDTSERVNEIVSSYILQKHSTRTNGESN